MKSARPDLELSQCKCTYTHGTLGRTTAHTTNGESTHTLTAGDRFHDPHIGTIRILLLPPLKCFNKQHVLIGKVVCLWKERILSRFVCSSLLNQGPLCPLQILDHQVLASELIVVTKVVDALVRIKMDLIVNTTHPLAVRPVYVPLCLALCLFPATVLQDIEHGVTKEGFKANTATWLVPPCLAIFPLFGNVIIICVAINPLLLLFIRVGQFLVPTHLSRRPGSDTTSQKSVAGRCKRDRTRLYLGVVYLKKKITKSKPRNLKKISTSKFFKRHDLEHVF